MKRAADRFTNNLENQPLRLKHNTTYRLDEYGDFKSGVTTDVSRSSNSNNNCYNEGYFKSDIDKSLFGHEPVISKTIRESNHSYKKENDLEIVSPDISIREETGIKFNGLVDTITTGSFLNDSGKNLYGNMFDQYKNFGQVYGLPYCTSVRTLNGEFPIHDSAVFHRLKEKVSPETFNKLTGDILNKIKISQEDLFAIVGLLPQSILESILCPVLGVVESYKFWNTYMYSTFLEGENNLVSLEPSKVAWVKGFGSLLVLAYKASKGGFHMDLSNHLVLFDHYDLCCRCGINKYYGNIMPGIEQTYSVVQNSYLPVSDLVCAQNFNSFVMKDCSPSVKNIILTVLQTPCRIDSRHGIDLFDMYVRVQDLNGLDVLTQAHLCPGQYANTLAILNHTPYADVGLEGLGELIESKMRELEGDSMFKPRIVAADKSKTFNFICLAHWGVNEVF